MHHRPQPTLRASSSQTSLLSAHAPPSNGNAPRMAPLIPQPIRNLPQPAPAPQARLSPSENHGHAQETGPRIFGLPLKYVSLVTLAVQNAALSIVMHYSRVSAPSSETYSPATAVLMNELLKGSISYVIALARVLELPPSPIPHSPRRASAGPPSFPQAVMQLSREIFSPDCWKLSVPAILYVVQNSLQFVAVSNLPVATFQVAYQMKILTTAAFSVALLRKRLTSTKWAALFFLALGVAIVQVQTAVTPAKPVVAAVEQTDPDLPQLAAHHVHVMSPLKGFGAVAAACFTSGLAGVYFEMVLKGSKADLWVRNVQLSLFSLLPAIAPILFDPSPPGFSLLGGLFRNFGGWAWATVSIQVFGGLVTAVVIKYSDNIMKGFATSLSIILSFLASVALFDFRLTPAFVIGSSTVLVATWMYNQPAGHEVPPAIAGVIPKRARPSRHGSPVSGDDPILGQFPGSNGAGKRSSPFGSPRGLASALGLAAEKDAGVRRSSEDAGFGFGLGEHAGGGGTSRYLSAPYGSPFPSRTPSPTPTPDRYLNANANAYSPYPSRTPSPSPVPKR